MKKKILIAEDDPGIMEAMQLMLEDEGYEVVTTVNGEAVMDMKQHLPDVMLLDIWMSGMDGREICMIMKKDPKIKHIPVIIVSANRDTKKIAHEVGANDFLAKPFEMQELLNKIKLYLPA